MDAEQLRDSVLRCPAIWMTHSADRREDLTPAFKRRTVYGKVSRYKLDAYLQLFDFPTPNISAEKRFTTTVPLQRLFLMNSDFMQIEAEELAKRVAAEPDNRARIRKLYSAGVWPRSERGGDQAGARLPARRADEGIRREQEQAAGGRGGGRGGRGGRGAAGAAERRRRQIAEAEPRHADGPAARLMPAKPATATTADGVWRRLLRRQWAWA